MTNNLQNIHKAVSENRKLLAILLDPDKPDQEDLVQKIAQINRNPVDLIFVGGSTVQPGKTGAFVSLIKTYTDIPVILFPGDYSQITPQADAILFLSLLSGRNPEYLIDQQVRSVPYLYDSGLEVIPTGYILIDGGKKTSVQHISQTEPISQKAVQQIVDTALAGCYLGKKLIYLEAGSGAENPVRPEIISRVKQHIDVPLIVGGGIRSARQLEQAYQNGADIVVIGNGFEENKELLQQLKEKSL